MKQVFAAALCFILAGCITGPQSALDVHGEDAARIAVLTWSIFIGGAVVLLVVSVALLIALAGPESWRRRLAGESAIRIGGLIWPAVTLTLLLAWSLWLMRETSGDGRPAALTIEVTGERWWWRVRYPDGRGGWLAEANELRIPVGRDVDLELKSADVIHSFWVPSLGGKLDMVPGRTNVLRLKAIRPGIYRGQCAEYCGGPHAQMAFEAVAMPESEFQNWRDAQPARPESEQVRRGAALFQSAGCGSCHAVRGSEAVGEVGPDLSRIGARRNIAAGALPNTPANLKRFIVENQTVKVGNRMPEFKLFSSEELDDIAAYLGELK